MVDLHRFTLPEDQNPRLLTSNLDLLLAANDASASPRISEDLRGSGRLAGRLVTVKENVHGSSAEPAALVERD